MSCAHLLLQPVRGALPTARAWVVARAREHGLPAETTQVVELLTSEIVANAVLHGSGPEIVVRAGPVGECFAVAVTDASDQLPVLRTSGPDVPGGQGMRLVERLAASWGVDASEHGGKSVWFHVPLQPEG